MFERVAMLLHRDQQLPSRTSFLVWAWGSSNPGAWESVQMFSITSILFIRVPIHINQNNIAELKTENSSKSIWKVTIFRISPPRVVLEVSMWSFEHYTTGGSIFSLSSSRAKPKIQPSDTFALGWVENLRSMTWLNVIWFVLVGHTGMGKEAVAFLLGTTASIMPVILSSGLRLEPCRRVSAHRVT